jgi:hypothetical protein
MNLDHCGTNPAIGRAAQPPNFFLASQLQSPLRLRTSDVRKVPPKPRITPENEKPQEIFLASQPVALPYLATTARAIL